MTLLYKWGNWALANLQWLTDRAGDDSNSNYWEKGKINMAFQSFPECCREMNKKRQGVYNELITFFLNIMYPSDKPFPTLGNKISRKATNVSMC